MDKAIPNKPNAFGNMIKQLKKSRMISISGVLLLMVVAVSLLSPHFLTEYNIKSVLRDLAFVGIIGVGQACVLIIGEIDLSVGKIASLCGVLGGMMMVRLEMNPYLSLVICLLIGAACGILNGTIITRLNLNAMVVTIGMTGVYGGANLVLTKGKAITNIPDEIYFLGQGDLFGKIPMPFVIMLIVMAIVVYIAKFTQFGRYMYAVGNSKNAAEILGIKVKLVRTMVFMMVGLLSAVAGMLMVARLGTSQPSIGDTWALNSIASSVIGGLALTGGVGNPGGAVLGAGIMAIIQNAIVLLGVSPYWQTAVSGVVVVLAISFDSITMMIGQRKKRKSKDKMLKDEMANGHL